MADFIDSKQDLVDCSTFAHQKQARSRWKSMVTTAISFVALTIAFLAGPATGFSSAPSTSLGAMRHPFADASGPLCLTRRNIKLETVRCQEQQGQVSKGFNVLELTGAIIPQGKLVTGVKTGWKLAWTTLMRELAPQSKDGAYVRPSYAFTNEIGGDKFPDEAGRYHLYAGKACPWCHRVELARAIRGLEDYMSVTIVLDRPEEASRGGWIFTAKQPDPVWGKKDLREVYDAAVSGGFRGRCTAPLVVDKKSRKLVCNESSDLVRMLNNIKAGKKIDLYPEPLRKQIDELNDWIYPMINNGVYRCGFATTQSAYDAAESELFEALAKVDSILSESRFLCGEHFTEADLRLFPTIFRFDSVYHTLFRCSRRRITDYPHIRAWLGDVYQLPGVSSTCDLDATVESYYTQLFPVNPGGIIARGPSPAELGLEPGQPRGQGDPFCRSIE